jgi:hypothetical protein
MTRNIRKKYSRNKTIKKRNIRKRKKIHKNNMSKKARVLKKKSIKKKKKVKYQGGTGYVFSDELTSFFEKIKDCHTIPSSLQDIDSTMDGNHRLFEEVDANHPCNKCKNVFIQNMQNAVMKLEEIMNSHDTMVDIEIYITNDRVYEDYVTEIHDATHISKIKFTYYKAWKLITL